jgi:hypothetical protein
MIGAQLLLLSIAVSLSFDEEGACPLGSFEKDVEGVLEAKIERDMRPDIRIGVVIKEIERAWVLSVETSATGEHHTREVTLASCALAKRAAVSIVALTLDRLLFRAAPITDAPPEPRVSRVSRAPIVADAAPVASAEQKSELGGIARAEVAFVNGVLPNPTAAVAFSGGITGGVWSVEGSLSVYVAQETRLADRLDVGGKVGLSSAALRGCRFFAGADLSLCTGAEVGVLIATPFGAVDEKRASLPWAAFVFGPAFSTPVVPGTSLCFRLEGILPVGPRFTLESVEGGEVVERPLFTPWPVALRLGLGGEISW